MGEKISAVLPISAQGRHGLDPKRFQILLFSLKQKDAQVWLKKIYLITPIHTTKIVKEICASVDFIDIEIIEEHDLIPDLTYYPQSTAGYRKQMLIKIGIASFIQDKFFLTLDSDIVCLQKITLDQLIIDNRALLQYEEKQVHPDWWKASSEVLSTTVDFNTLGISVTPAILSTQICQDLLKDIEHKYGQSWGLVLMDFHVFWTEYTLYFSYAQHRNYVDKFHLLPDDTRNIPLRDDNYTIWFSGDIDRLSKVQQLQPLGPFGVLQSTSGVSLESIMKYLPHMLQISSSDKELLQLKKMLGLSGYQS